MKTPPTMAPTAAFDIPLLVALGSRMELLMVTRAGVSVRTKGSSGNSLIMMKCGEARLRGYGDVDGPDSRSSGVGLECRERRSNDEVLVAQPGAGG